MTTRLILLCAGATRLTRLGCFPDPAEPLDKGGRAKVRAFLRDWPADSRTYVSPAAAARETVAVLDIAGEDTPALRDQDAGAWAGLGPEAIGEAAMLNWLAAPARGAPEGEPASAVRARVGAWMNDLSAGRVLAVTHAAVLRAAIAHALDVQDAATIGIDVAPLTRVVLSRQIRGRWRLQALVPTSVLSG